MQDIGRKDESDISKLVRMIMARQFDPVRPASGSLCCMWALSCMPVNDAKLHVSYRQVYMEHMPGDRGCGLLVDGVWNPLSQVTNSSVAMITGDRTSHKHSCCAQCTAQLQQDDLKQAGAGTAAAGWPEVDNKGSSVRCRRATSHL